VGRFLVDGEPRTQIEPPIEEVTCEQALADVRAAFRTRRVFDRLLDDAVSAACAAGVPVTVLARSLGIHRATFYRQFRVVEEAQSSNEC
jgi:transcriptional regulator of acetoin/glycerol metabolism